MPESARKSLVVSNRHQRAQLNACWHIAATIYFDSYGPEVVTAVLLVLPATSYLL